MNDTEDVVWRGVSWQPASSRKRRRCRACNRAIPAGESCFRPAFDNHHVKAHMRLCLACAADKA